MNRSTRLLSWSSGAQLDSSGAEDQLHPRQVEATAQHGLSGASSFICLPAVAREIWRRYFRRSWKETS